MDNPLDKEELSLLLIRLQFAWSSNRSDVHRAEAWTFLSDELRGLLQREQHESLISAHLQF